MAKLREVKIEKAIRSRTKVESLRCDLTPDEQRVKGLDLAQQEKDIYDLNQQKKLSADDFKEKIELATRRMTGCAQVLRQGYEYRPIECEEIYDYSTGTVRLIRKDTRIIVHERPMQEVERQMTFVADAEFEEVPKQPEANA